MTLKKLTDRQIVEFALSKPRDPDELWNYVRVLFNISIPRKAVTEDSVAPFTAFERAYFAKDPVAVWIGARGTGKALSVDSMVLTPHGYVRMGSLKVGDIVFDENGSPTSITGVFPQGKRLVYRVNFYDGASVICDADHLWKVRRTGSSNYEVKTLAEIIETGFNDRSGFNTWQIPLTKPVQFLEYVDKSIDFYELGLKTKEPLPDELLYSSVEQRKALLRGICDSAKVSDKGGRICVSNRLYPQVAFLVESLGGIITPSNHVYDQTSVHACYTFSPTERIISGASLLGYEECQCISVDSPQKTFLTDNCIVTHNSVLLALLASVELLTLKCNISIIAGSRDQSERVLKYLRNEDANMAGILWGAINAPRMLLNEDLISKKTLKTIPGLLGGETDPGFEIVAHASSEASVRGVHPSRLRLDEVDVAEYETIESSRGCTSSIRGIDTQTVYSSTYHKYNGTMSKIIKEAKQKGWPVYCLWEESKVLTEFGIEKRIKDLQIGELVLTREGWKPTTHVTFMGYKPTIILKLSNGRNLTLTSDHKVATPSGWVEAGTLGPLSKVIGSNMIKRTNYSITHVEVVSISEGHILPVWDIGVKDCHEFLAEGVIVHNCWTWREVMESNGGFMSQKFIDTKRGELSQAQWDAEYENRGPQSGVRVFDKSHLDILFNPRIGNIPGVENSHWKLYENDKNPTGRFYHGADWARDNHWTVLHTLQRTASGFQTAAWYRTNQKPYPQIIREVVSHIKDYKGPIAHDSTGVGKALDDLLVDNGAKRSSVFPVEWTRQKLIHEMAGFYQHAIENEELVGPFIQFAYSEHEYLTEDMLRGKDHCPDSVAAAMMAYYLARQYAAGRNCVVMRIQ